jgi:hypothetical protein
VPQRAADTQAEPAGTGVVKSGRFATRATVPMNEAQPRRAHLPRLLDDRSHGLPNEVARPIAVEVDLYEEWFGSFCGHCRSLSSSYAMGCNENADIAGL